MNETKSKIPRRYKLLKLAAILTVALLVGLLMGASGDHTAFGQLAILLGACAIGGCICTSKDFQLFRDQFYGDRVYSTTKGSNVGHPYKITVTAAGGTPTFVPVNGGRGLQVDMDSTVEVENVCIDFGDKLQFDIDEITEVGILVEMNQAALDETSQFAIGLASARNDAIDSIAQAALFRIVGADSTTAVVVETDDGTNNNDDKATGQTLINAKKWLVINFATGKADVRFLVGGQPVATDVTFDMSNYSGAFQLFAQMQKTADANVDGFTIRDWYVRGRD